MRMRCDRWLCNRALAAVVGLTLTAVETTSAQEAKANPAGAAAPAPAPARRGGLRLPGAMPQRPRPPQAETDGINDPFADALSRANGAGKAVPAWPYRFRFRIVSFDQTPFVAVYYPAQRGTAPVVLLVHEKGRLGSDFEDPIEDLKSQGLAEYLQSQGYAVLVPDLRGHGANPRRDLGPQDRLPLARDLQAAYHFLIDRHNREELNLARFGVVALGEGADLVVAWAAQPGAAVSSEGRLGDLQGLVLVSPQTEGFGIRLGPSLASIAPRIPMLLMGGERDEPTAAVLKDAGPIVDRQRRSKVESFATSLRGYKLLRFEPKVPDAIAGFLETTVKRARAGEWEPRYNLTPVGTRDIVLLRPGEKAIAPAPAAAPPPAEVKKDAAP